MFLVSNDCSLLSHSDYHAKEKALKTLRQKALNKNPDEFHFHMINSQVQDGRHYEKREEEVSDEQLKLMRSQDMKYIAFKRKIELEKIAKLEASLHQICLTPNRPKNKHIIFLHDDNEEEVKQRLQRIVQQSEPKPEDAMTKKQYKQYKELRKRKERAAQLTIILDKLRIKSQVSQTNGQKPVKSKDGDPTCAPVYCWPSDRQK